MQNLLDDNFKPKDDKEAWDLYDKRQRRAWWFLILGAGLVVMSGVVMNVFTPYQFETQIGLDRMVPLSIFGLGCLLVLGAVFTWIWARIQKPR